jgi:hypothetical protein
MDGISESRNDGRMGGKMNEKNPIFQYSNIPLFQFLEE